MYGVEDVDEIFVGLVKNLFQFDQGKVGIVEGWWMKEEWFVMFGFQIFCFGVLDDWW